MATRKTTSKKTASKKRASTQPVGADRRAYELTIVVPPTVKADRRSTVIESLKKTIEKAKGVVDRVDEIGLRDLAYPIRKERTGWYATLQISLPPDALAGVDALVRRDENILRHLLLTRTT